jgi:DNA polymerase V
MIVHIDCNSFYASCEVSLRPDLKNKPVVVANYNEAGGGIILALTKEAKALGLKRGNPVFQVKDVLDKYNVTIFPANLNKYVDISHRVMQVVIEQGIVNDFVQYSVDEFFGTIPTDSPDELRKYLSEVKETIYHGTSIPVSCGASVTNTLAKVATWYAKHYNGYQNICVLPFDKITKALQGIPIGSVWGIGYRGAPKFKSLHINTAYDYAMKSEDYIRRLTSVAGVRTWKELHGTACIDIRQKPKQQTIMHSRTFTYMTDSQDTLNSYISNYAAGAARKLREQHSVCETVTTFIMTNRHRGDLLQYGNNITRTLSVPTADTVEIVKAATDCLKKIYKAGFQYKRAGVILGGICIDDAVPQDLFSSKTNDILRSRKLMAATDAINTKYGMNMVKLASQSIAEKKLKLDNAQPMKNETTNIQDIITINCNK